MRLADSGRIAQSIAVLVTQALSAAEQKRWEAKVQPIYAAWVARTANGAKVLEAFKTELAKQMKMEGWPELYIFSVVSRNQRASPLSPTDPSATATIILTTSGCGTRCRKPFFLRNVAAIT